VRHKALVIADGVHESGRREVIGVDVGAAETRGVLAGVLALAAGQRAGRGQAVCLRRPPGPQARDRAGAGLPLAALHGALPQRHARPRQPGAAAAGLWRDPWDLHRRHPQRGQARLGQVVEQLAPHAPKVAGLLEDAEADLLAFYAFPAEHHPKLRSTNPLERVNREIGRRSDVVGIFPNDAALLRLAGMLLLEQNDEWLVGRRYLSESSMALVINGGHPAAPDVTGTQEVAQLTAS
jgi:putative transposase